MKKIWIILSVIAVIVIAAYFYLKFRKSEDFEPLLKAKLQQAVKDGSNGLYVLDMDGLDVDVLEARATVRNVRLTIDSARLKELEAAGKAPVDVYKMSVADLLIDGLSINDLLKKKNIDLSVLNIKNPTVEIFHPVGKNNQVSKDTSTLYSRIAKTLGHLQIKNLVISNMNFKYHNIAHQERLTAFKNISMKFNDLEIDSITQYDTTRFLYARDAYIYFNDYSFRTADSLYFINMDSLTLHANRRTIDIKGIALQPRYNKQQFSRKLTTYTDRYDIKFATAVIKNVDWYHLFLGEGFAASRFELSNGEMEIYANRYLPLSPKLKVGNYPHQLLAKLNLPVDVDTILVKNFRVTYRELNPKSQKEGYIVFDNVNATFSNITNIKEKIALNKTLKLTAASKLMSAGNLSAVFAFDLVNVKNGNFSVDANLGPMDGRLLNPAAEPLGLFRINNLNVKNLKAHVDATNTNGRGTVYLVYSDLDITALEKEEDSKQLKKRKFLSFLANTFIVNKSNEKGEAKPEQASFKRDPQRSFFYLIWKTMLEGIKATVA